MQALDSTVKQKIAAEPMGATNIFNFTLKPISYTSFRFSIWGLGINVYLEDKWSPEQVCGWLKKEGIVALHHETIYQHILADKRAGGDLHTYLRHQNKGYRKHYGSAHNRSCYGIPDRVDIDKPSETKLSS